MENGNVMEFGYEKNSRYLGQSSTVKFIFQKLVAVIWDCLKQKLKYQNVKERLHGSESWNLNPKNMPIKVF